MDCVPKHNICHALDMQKLLVHGTRRTEATQDDPTQGHGPASVFLSSQAFTHARATGCLLTALGSVTKEQLSREFQERATRQKTGGFVQIQGQGLVCQTRSLRSPRRANERVQAMGLVRTPARALLPLLLLQLQLASCLVDACFHYETDDSTTLRSAEATSGFFPAILSFGSSVADTGAGVLLRVDSPANSFPYGIDFPATRTGRWSNGRLLVDLWAEALGLPYLDPFLKGMDSSFRQGANFACGGSRVTKSNGSGPVTLNLDVQLYQFKLFKRGVLAADGCPDGQKICSCSLPPTSVFRDALYIVASGANDLLSLIFSCTPIAKMKAAIPEVSAAIISSVKELYEEGARYILVEDVYPIGCMPITLATNLSIYGEAALPDSSGCVQIFNQMATMHNSLLKKETAAFGQLHPDASVALVDTYSIRLDLMTNPAKHGFKYGIAACCGIERLPWRFSNTDKCGLSSKPRPCADRSQYVVWDGLHYTEAANIATMKAFLTGEYFYPGFPTWNTTTSCSLVQVTM
ncbi:hypothetical protein Mapa_004244 [Marchantia paleacea]|nr:hypothetical protein Mapa_004244 [Marchantia paleacea]